MAVEELKFGRDSEGNTMYLRSTSTTCYSSNCTKAVNYPITAIQLDGATCAIISCTSARYKLSQPNPPSTITAGFTLADSILVEGTQSIKINTAEALNIETYEDADVFVELYKLPGT